MSAFRGKADMATDAKMSAFDHEWREFAALGGLASCGTNLKDAFRLVGAYAARVLKGEKPADLPVIQPTKYELVINIKTAKVLGLTMSNQTQLLADEVIE